VREETADEFQVMLPAGVGQAVDPDGVQTWVAQQDFRQAAGGRVAFEDCADVTTECAEHFPRHPERGPS
jgi:hypothetical protein